MVHDLTANSDFQGGRGFNFLGRFTRELERVSDNLNSSNNMRLNGRGEVFNVLQEKANDSARLARKYVEGKDKVRKTIGRIAKNM